MSWSHNFRCKKKPLSQVSETSNFFWLGFFTHLFALNWQLLFFFLQEIEFDNIISECWRWLFFKFLLDFSCFFLFGTQDFCNSWWNWLKTWCICVCVWKRERYYDLQYFEFWPCRIDIDWRNNDYLISWFCYLWCTLISVWFLLYICILNSIFNVMMWDWTELCKKNLILINVWSVG